jgi:hypothetical protein
VASIWAEALPYVGAGTILAVTAAEIYDACETLKDVEELRRGFDLEPSADGTSMKVCGLGLPSEFELGTSREDGIEADYRDCMRAAGLRRGKERECEAEKRRRLEKARNTLAHCLVNAGPSRAMKERCLERHASGELR